jgi:hypothetical protein
MEIFKLLFFWRLAYLSNANAAKPILSLVIYFLNVFRLFIFLV